MARIHDDIVKVLREHPLGLSAGEIREKLGLGPSEQSQLDRRRRDLYRTHVIERRRTGSVTTYVYRGLKTGPVEPPASLKVRARAIHEAMGRCGMCGRTVNQHQITLVVDHRIPLDWGGASDLSNLWAICEECNAGKKAHFATFDPEVMRQVLGHLSVHVRIGELLKARSGIFVPPALISLVAGQSDWMKRLRELRYLGWKIDTKRSRLPSGQTIASYRVTTHKEWPTDPTNWIRTYERERQRRRKGLR